MTLAVASAVLFSALLHASWNAVIRLRADRVAAITLLATFAMVISAPGLFLTAPLRPEAWPWLAASVALHFGSALFLANAYSHGDLGKVYPIARGTAPLFTLAASLVIVREPLATTTILGIVTLGLGILALTLDQGVAALRAAPRGVLLALGTSMFVAAYTIVDGLGARAAGDPHAFTLWMFFLNGIPLLLYALWVRGPEATKDMIVDNWRPGFAAGGIMLAAYWIVIWAMTVAPIALVAALRETSVIMAVVIGAVFLGERFTFARIVSVAVVLAGLVLMRL